MSYITPFITSNYIRDPLRKYLLEFSIIFSFFLPRHFVLQTTDRNEYIDLIELLQPPALEILTTKSSKSKNDGNFLTEYTHSISRSTDT